jgi:hypothetical protein
MSMFSNRKIVLVIVLLITLSITAYVLIVVIPTRLARRSYEGARQIGHDISKIFQVTPEVTVKNTVVLEQQTPIMELATLSQTFQHRYEWTNTWLGSTKKIKMTGSFQAKAGFDLSNKFSLEINDDVVVVTLPGPKLLSLESMDDVTFEDENGFINWVNMDDRSKAVNAFTSDAKRYAQEAAFVARAQEEMEKKMTEILRLHGKRAEIRYTEIERIPSY